MAKIVKKEKGGAVEAFDPSMFEADAGKGMEGMGSRRSGTTVS